MHEMWDYCDRSFRLFVSLPVHMQKGRPKKHNTKRDPDPITALSGVGVEKRCLLTYLHSPDGATFDAAIAKSL